MKDIRNDLKICVIGCGKHCTANILSTLHLLGIPIAGISSRHMEHSESAARRFGILAPYDDYRVMLEKEKPDAVFVVTDQNTQWKIAIDCLKAGADVFVEKPVGMNAEQARAVAVASMDTGKEAMVGFMKRFSPSYVKLRQLMQADEFGRVLSFTGMFAITEGRNGWDNNVYTKVGGVHYVDLMRFLFGEPVSVSGLSNSNGTDVDNIFTMRFDSGVIGSMFFGGLKPWKRHWEEICVTGHNGFAKVNNMVGVQYHVDRPIIADLPRWTRLDEEDLYYSAVNTSSSGGWRDLYLNGYVGEIKYFLECIEDGKKPMCNAEDNVKTMEFCDLIVGNLK